MDVPSHVIDLVLCGTHSSHSPLCQTRQDKKIYGYIGLSFSIISATILLIDYFVQISVIQPSLLQGETEGIAILTQYNPHGIFIALEEIGYLMMSLSFLCVAPVFRIINYSPKPIAGYSSSVL